MISTSLEVKGPLDQVTPLLGLRCGLRLRAEDEAFRAELQAWLDDNLPEFAEQGEIGSDHADATSGRWPAPAWQQRLHEGRWAAINWPEEWGGREATTMQNVIYAEVMAEAKTPASTTPMASGRSAR